MNVKITSEKPLTIPPVSTDQLWQQTQKGKIDPGAEKLLQAEKAYILKRRSKVRVSGEQNISDDGTPENLVGLALSGGGIRSATFSLGVMQALSRCGAFDKIDYLSTVSGGGYIGSALTWLTSGKSRAKRIDDATEEVEFSTSDGEFPFGTDDPAPGSSKFDNINQKHMLKYIRQHGNYLAPGAGISIVSLLGIVLRGTLLNLLVWLPIFAFIFFGALELSKKLKDVVPTGEGTTLNTITKAVPGYEGVVVFDALLLAGLGIIVILCLLVVVYSITTWIRRAKSVISEKTWYALRRSGEKTTAFLIPTAIIFLVLGSLSIVYQQLADVVNAVGPIAVFTGIGVAIKSFIGSGGGNKAVPVGIMVPLSSALFLYGVMLVSYQIASEIYPSLSYPYLLAVALATIALGFLVNLNYISIHRYYRDRLMETFMPDIDSALNNRTKAAVGADSAKLGDFTLGAEADDGPRTPYHIVNTNIILVNSKVPAYRDRGGDNFILSPEYCGSNATGWRATNQFMGGKMTLATSVAISGAAANPNAGVGGAGLTRNKFLSLVMSLLNLKLGYWASNPHRDHHTTLSANHFLPGLYSFGNAMGFLGFREDRNFIQLSDGGHFENTGVYELVRRRVRLIIVCDGSGDPDTSFSDFQTTIRRVEDDFGASIQVDDKLSPNAIVPVEQKDERYPKDRKFANQGFMKGKITYSDGSEGTIIYLKTTLIKGVSFKVKGYAASNPTFPDQSTADQFFDEMQFESYRELGYAIAMQMYNHQCGAEDEDKKTDVEEMFFRKNS